MLNIRTATLSIGLVAILLLVVPLVTAWTAPVAGGSSSQINLAAGSSPSASLAKPLLSYRPHVDECFDVPLRELTACRADGRAPASYSAPVLDECFDVSISELASCHAASQSPAP